MIDFFYNLAKLVSRASFVEAPTALYLENRPARQGAVLQDRIKRLQPFLPADSVMDADLAGRLAKLKDIKSYKEPLLEAVANSIQAIQQVGQKDGQIEVFIEWLDESKSDIVAANGGEHPYRKIQNIIIRDNGPGFTKENFKSFSKLDSRYKAKEFGCLGVGRLLWLKVFSEVEVESVYKEDGKKFYRRFRFNVEEEISPADEREATADEAVATTIKLKNIRPEFQNKRTVSVDDIAEAIFRHFLLLYVLDNVPEIIVRDGEERRSVIDFYERSYDGQKPKRSVFEACGYEFQLIQQKLNTRPTGKLATGVYFCAGQRVVSRCEKGIDPRVCNALGAGDGSTSKSFMYVGLLQGDYLDQNVSSSRKKIIFPNLEKGEEDGELDFEPIEEQIFDNVNKLVRDYLKEEFDELDKSSQIRIQKFVDEEAPEFKGFVNRYGKELFVKPKEKNSNLYDYINQQFFEYERAQRREIDSLISVDWIGENASEKIREIADRIEPFKSYDLVRFAAKRRYYLDLLDKAISFDDDGEYRLEDAVHSLVFPKGKDSTDADAFDRQNLWLVDDRLSFGHYIASDLSFKKNKTTDVDSLKRMDIESIKVYSSGEDNLVAELSIIEFKRPGRNDYSANENPIEQVMNYVDMLRKGKLRTLSGREIPNVKTVPYFCFIVADFTDNLIDKCERYNFVPNAVKDSYYGYYPRANAYFEVMSFNAMYNKAKERNHALLVAAGLRPKPE